MEYDLASASLLLLCQTFGKRTPYLYTFVRSPFIEVPIVCSIGKARNSECRILL